MKDEYKNIIPVLSDTIHFNQLADNEFILCNTQDKHYLRINRKVYRVLCLVDGEKSLEDISLLYESAYHEVVTATSIHRLLTDVMASYGMMKGYDDKIKPYTKPSYLKLSFIIFNQNLLSKIVRYFSPLFKKEVFIYLITSILLCTTIILLNHIDLYKNFDVRASFLLFIILQFVSVTFHEVGHASAANYFGAEHGGIGGGFYLFRPVYYADVTDIWKLKKNQRIVVNLAGMYFEFIFCFIVLLISSLFQNYTLTMTGLFIMISTLFNLNPFIRSDGYWVLSDLTNQPNLSSKSRKKVIKLLKQVFLRKKIKWTYSDLYMIIYGCIKYVFLSLFLYYTLIKNPASIIYFPVNLYHFVKDIVIGNSISLYEFRKLIIPMFFYYLAYNFLKSLIKKMKDKPQK
jgi:putative peptide zinc metalloprotease protein